MKKRTITFSVFVVAIAILTIALSGCDLFGPAETNLFVGTWSAGGAFYNYTFIFESDMTFTSSSSTGGSSTGIYDYTDEGVLTLEYVNSTSEFTYEIINEMLYLTTSYGITIPYTRQ